MSSRAMTPEEIEQWKTISKNYHAAQQKLVGQRAKMQDLLASTTKAVAELRKAQGPGAQFLRAQHRMLQLSMRQLEVFPLDGKEYAPSPESKGPAYEARDLELSFAVVEMEEATLECLVRLVKPALELEAAPDVVEGPPSWQTEVSFLVSNAQRRESWQKFLGAHETFRFAMDEARKALAEPPEEPSPAERLAWLQTIGIPALKGHLYRVNGVLRQLPTGTEILKDVRAAMIAELQLGKPRPSTAPLRRAAAPAAPQPARAATDRLREIFKPNNKK